MLIETPQAFTFSHMYMYKKCSRAEKFYFCTVKINGANIFHLSRVIIRIFIKKKIYASCYSHGMYIQVVDIFHILIKLYLELRLLCDNPCIYISCCSSACVCNNKICFVIIFIISLSNIILIYNYV